MLTITDLFDLDHTIAKDYLAQFTYPWEALAGIKDFILSVGPTLEGYDEVSPQVWVHKTATVAPTAFLGAPCIIGAHTEVRHCAFIRGSALVGENCVVGNSVELKNVILFDNVQVPRRSGSNQTVPLLVACEFSFLPKAWAYYTTGKKGCQEKMLQIDKLFNE